MKFEICIGILATAFCMSADAQTVDVRVLDQAGAQTVLRSRNSGMCPLLWQLLIPPAICLLSSAWIVSARQARTSLSGRRDQRRMAFVPAGVMALRGGMRVNGVIAGAVGLAGPSKETDTEIASTAASVLSPSPAAPQHH